MNNILRILFVSLVAVFAAPSFATDAVQVWHCELNDDAHEEDVHEAITDWFNAAKKMDGGKDVRVTINFPVAVTNTGETDFLIVIALSSFEKWGKFWDHYPDSAAADIEEAAEDKFVCPDSALWESDLIK